MYQSIDDTSPEAGSTNAQDRQSSRRLIILALLLCVLILVIAAMGSTRSDPVSQHSKDLAAQKQDYLAALAAPKPALRRARLMDLMQTYPLHERLSAIRAQLDVINAREAKDWAYLSDLFYDPDRDLVEKSIALDRYANLWGPALIGGRKDEVGFFRAALENAVPALAEFEDGTITDELPDFAPSPESPISETVPDEQMAGALREVPRGTYIPPIRRPGFSSAEPVSTELRIRRNVSPNYPSRAERRGIEAVVTLSLFVDDDGDVEMIDVISVSAPRYEKDFVRAAKRAARRTRFHPRRENGRNVPTPGVIKRYVFQLDGN